MTKHGQILVLSDCGVLHVIDSESGSQVLQCNMSKDVICKNPQMWIGLENMRNLEAITIDEDNCIVAVSWAGIFYRFKQMC